MSRAVLALGTNMGDREENLKSAVQSMALLPETQILITSYIYETEPVGFLDQPLFLNAAAVIETSLSPRALLGACLGIEAAFGRVRRIKNGPRVLDIDLLAYENEISEDKELILPHPRIRERAFVLAPLFDLFPDGRVLDMDLSECKGKAVCSGIVRYKNRHL